MFNSSFENKKRRLRNYFQSLLIWFIKFCSQTMNEKIQNTIIRCVTKQLAYSHSFSGIFFVLFMPILYSKRQFWHQFSTHYFIYQNFCSRKSCKIGCGMVSGGCGVRNDFVKPFLFLDTLT